MDVLVVEDNKEVADSLAFLLDCYGHHATVAENGDAALSLVASHAFELVLLDEDLPGIKGSAVARAIITAPFAGRPFIVSMTGGSDVDGLPRFFDVCLRKPFASNALLQTIEDARIWGQASAFLAAYALHCCERRSAARPIIR
ncbi:response regulator [Paraburkholderia sp. RL17-373-BIF-A]|uniref:response regulator n=1 Tax=Paraburkholderia sp. RL17-373-BIF-A TaxID=3031629 RepID=UPI0038B6D757